MKSTAEKIVDLKLTLTALDAAEFAKYAYATYKSVSNEKSYAAARQFFPGDRVLFKTKSGVTYTGTVDGVNVKTVSVTTTDGRSWRVAPSLLVRTGAEGGR